VRFGARTLAGRSVVGVTDAILRQPPARSFADALATKPSGVSAVQWRWGTYASRGLEGEVTVVDRVAPGKLPSHRHRAGRLRERLHGDRGGGEAVELTVR